MSKITLDDLAAMIAKQFNAQGERFDKINQRLDLIESDINDLKTGQKHLEESIWEVKTELNGLKKQLERINKRSLEDDNALASDHIKLKQRVLVLERELKKIKFAH